MKKIAIAGIMLVFVIALLGCNQPPIATDETTGLKDCGTSEQCITEATKICEKAFATLTQSSTSPKTSMSMKIIVSGFQADTTCKIKYSIEKIEIDPNDPDAASMQILIGMLQGKEMTCLIPKEKLSETGTGGVVAMESEELSSMCTGSLVDTMKLMTGGTGTN